MSLSANGDACLGESERKGALLRERLGPFLAANSEVSLSDTRSGCRISTPWADDTLYLRVGHDAVELIEALDNVRMPPVFSAIWHSDTRDLEFIFTVAPEWLAKKYAVRSFTFRFGGDEYRCDWAESSERLVLIADSSRPNGPPTTSYRNLESYAMYAQLRADPQNEEIRARMGTPLSFWIRAIDWDEAKVIDLAYHINFYTRYFDYRASQIILNEPSGGPTNFSRVDEPHGEWPSEVSAKRLDANLLTVWRGASESSDVFMGYLLYYQVLEYAASYFLDDKTRKGVDRILRAPDVAARATESARRVVDLVSTACSAKEDKRMEDLLRELVDPELMWRLIEPNKAVFARACWFTGGVVVEPLIGDDTTADTFSAKWPGKLGRALRHVRNAVAHPGEPGGAGTIESCEANRPCLEPWLLLCKGAASQVVLHFPQ